MSLFVGGPIDGKRQAVPIDDPYARVATLDPTSGPYSDPFARSYTTHTYYRQQFRENGNMFEVFFHNSIRDPLVALIKGYRGHRKPRRRP